MDKMQLFKALAPGFLPLVIFIAADSIWGTRIGLAVAIIFGLIELAAVFIREKRLDAIIILDVALITVLGVVSITLDNDIFFKLKPAVIELIFCVILGISVFSPMNIMMMLMKRYLDEVTLSPAQMMQFSRSLRGMFFLFAGHTLLIVYSAFFMSRAAWGFISGGLFYIIFAVYLLLEFIRNKRVKLPDWNVLYADDEWFDVVDAEGRIVGSAPRTICHSRPGILHPVIHIHVIDDKDRIYLQKRALTKQIQPGKWDTAVGGHVLSGEKVEAAMQREAREELGLKEFKVQFLTRYVWESPVESELVFVFVSRYLKPITVNREEIDEGKFWRIKKIKENLGSGIFTPNFEYEFPMLLREYFKQDV